MTYLAPVSSVDGDHDARPGRVLIIDDDEDFLILLAHQLRPEGYVVMTVSEPESALATVEHFKPDICLVDQRMPRISGLTICLSLRVLHPIQFLPIILLTNDVSLDLPVQAVAAGVNDTLDKSTPPELLRLRIRTAIRTKRLADRAQSQHDEQLFLARLMAGLGDTLQTDAILGVAATALSRLNIASMSVIYLQSDEPQVLTFGADPIEFDTPRLRGMFSLAQDALRTNLDPELCQFIHVRLDWPKRSGQPHVHRALASHPRPRVWLAVEPVTPFDDNEMRLFDTIVERLVAPLDNSHLYATVSQAHQELSATLKKLSQAQTALVHQEKMASIGQLAAGVAHEINNPLAFVISNMNVLQDYARDLSRLLRFHRRETHLDDSQLGTIDPEFLLTDLEQMISESIEGGNRVHAIVRSLKNFAHTGNGELEEVDLVSLIESALTILTGDIKSRAVISRDLALVPAVRGDRGKLGQVFLNIIVNAAQAIPAEREGKIHVRLFSQGGMTCFEVTDDGTGIPEAVRPRIFEPFFTTKDRAHGTGLGLAISAGIVRDHGGVIEVHTLLDQGTTFTVRLPGRQTLPIPIVEILSSPVNNSLPSILYIDDERFLLNAFVRAFKPSALVTVAHGGEEALAILGERPDFDVIFCDLHMDRVGGIEVHEWLSKNRPDLMSRFVILTAGAANERSRVFLAACPVPVVYKPFSLHELTQLVSEMVRARGASAEAFASD